MTGHGAPTGQHRSLRLDDLDLFLPYLVTCDLDVWADAHPCTCGEDAGLHREGCPQA